MAINNYACLTVLCLYKMSKKQPFGGKDCFPLLFHDYRVPGNSREFGRGKLWKTEENVSPETNLEKDGNNLPDSQGAEPMRRPALSPKLTQFFATQGQEKSMTGPREYPTTDRAHFFHRPLLPAQQWALFKGTGKQEKTP